MEADRGGGAWKTTLLLGNPTPVHIHPLHPIHPIHKIHPIPPFFTLYSFVVSLGNISQIFSLDTGGGLNIMKTPRLGPLLPWVLHCITTVINVLDCSVFKELHLPPLQKGTQKPHKHGESQVWCTWKQVIKIHSSGA